MRYRSKKDLWLIGPLWVALLLPFVWAISFLIHPYAPGVGAWLTFFVVIGADVLILTLTYPMYYEITPPLLLVRSGVIRVKIPLNSIQQVFPDRTLGSAPAWSLDRLRVDYLNRWGTTFVHIAPKDAVKFMQDLVENTEGLEVMDGRVIRHH